MPYSEAILQPQYMMRTCIFRSHSTSRLQKPGGTWDSFLALPVWVTVGYAKFKMDVQQGPTVAC